MQRVVVWDTNVYRSGFGSQGKPLTEEGFTALLAAEERREVQPYADPWVILELLAHLADEKDEDYARSRHALRRIYVRCLSGRKGCGLLSDSESEIARLITKKPLPGHAETTQWLATRCAEVGRTPPDQPLSLTVEDVGFIAKHVAEMEEWFATHCREQREHLDQFMAQIEEQPVRKVAWAASKKHLEEARAIRTATAEAIIRGALRDLGDPVPPQLNPKLVERVQDVLAVGIEFYAIVLRKVAFDGANVEKPRTRNLMWDQRISYCIGQKVGEAPIWFVTDDPDFHAASALTPYRARVRWPAEYEAWLSEKSHGLRRSRR